MHDGVRLATLHVWPLDVEAAPALLLRTADGRAGRRGSRLLSARLLAESGYHVLVQDVRGRHDSEGHFRPHEAEVRDGASSLEWAVAQPWCDGRIGLLGRGYSGFAAWAALAGAPEKVHAMVVASCARDVYAAHHPGGALAVELALSRAVQMGDRAREAPRGVDLARGLVFRPPREADRVALRRIDWYRDWVDHPRRDDFWQTLVPHLPERMPPTLLLTNWRDPFLRAALEDHRRLDSRPDHEPGLPRVVIREASPGRRPLRLGRRDPVLHDAVEHFDRHLGLVTSDDEPCGRVRYFVSGIGSFRQTATWPPPEARPLALHLHDSSDGPGLRDEAPPSVGSPQHLAHDLRHDPSRIVRAHDSGAIAGSAKATYLSAALAAPLCIAGNVRAELFVASSGLDADFTARLVDFNTGQAGAVVCEGIARCRWRGMDDTDREPRFLAEGEIVSLSIDLGPAAHRFGTGHRLGLEIGCCGFPRFDCNPGGRDDPARARPDALAHTVQRVFHDGDHASKLLLPVIEEA
jgi:putative CocE/NonD family hydrolase